MSEAQLSLPILGWPFDLKIFLLGLAGILSLFLALIGLTAMIGPGLLMNMENERAAQVFTIAPEKPSSDSIAPDSHADDHHTPAHSEQHPAPLAAGASPFEQFRRHTAPQPGKKLVAIGLTHFGLSAEESEKAIASLPLDVTLIASPYAPNGLTATQRAQDKGYEVWINLPIESRILGQADTGPLTLLKKISLELNKQRLATILKSGRSYAGIAAFTDDVFMDTKPLMEKLLGIIFTKNLGFFELNNQAPAFVETQAALQGAPYMRATRSLSQRTPSEYLEALELQAEAQGQAAGIMILSPASIKAIIEWAKNLPENIQLVPISTLSQEQTP